MIPSGRNLLQKSVLLSWPSQADKVCYGLVDGFVTGSQQVQRPMFQSRVLMMYSLMQWDREQVITVLECSREIEVRPKSKVELEIGNQSWMGPIVYKGKSGLKGKSQSWESNYSTSGCQALLRGLRIFHKYLRGARWSLSFLTPKSSRADPFPQVLSF